MTNTPSGFENLSSPVDTSAITQTLADQPNAIQLASVSDLASNVGMRQDHSKPYRILIKGDLANDTSTYTE